MEQSPITIAQSGGEDWDVLEVGGELDLSNAGALDDALAATRASTVILDLGEVTFLDSAGIRAIDRANRRLAGADRALLLVAPPDSRAAWTFRVAGFADAHVFASRELATARARAPSMP